MQSRDNYLLQAQQAKAHFLTYDQEKLIRKFSLTADDGFLYTRLLGIPYRVSRSTGDLQKQISGQWVDGNSHAEVMTLMDLLCDSREDRCLSGTFQAMQNFGQQFHQNLLENGQDPEAMLFDRDPERLHRACKALGGIRLPYADISYQVELFEGLPIAVHFWHGDEDFAPRLLLFWDRNSLQYLRYETMYFAAALFRKRLLVAS